MTIGKATALSLGFVGAVAFGVWVGPYVTGRADTTMDAAMRAPIEDAAMPASQEPAKAPATARLEPALPAVPASSAELQRRLGPVPNEGMTSRGKGPRRRGSPR
jgi:hypothetical protein